MTNHEIEQSVRQLARSLTARGWRLAIAESCTGGWIAKCCTDLAGSSAWLDRAYVTYSDQAKVEMLGVEALALRDCGAVSESVARQMAEGARRASRAQLSCAVTGIAGPDGGSGIKPVGTVWFAWSMEGQPTRAECRRFPGGRDDVRRAAVAHALLGLVQQLSLSMPLDAGQ